jgi:hypothetical protein
MKMKKKGLSIICVLMVMLVVVGCSSGPKVYDPSIPLEQSSTLELGCNVKGFNGGKVLWMSGKTVIIPAGTHTLIVHNSESAPMGTSVTYGEVPMEAFTFIAGHTYLIQAPITGRTITGKITDVTSFFLDLVPDATNPNASQYEGRWEFTDGKSKVELIFAKNEYIRVVNGTYYSRGFFTHDENSVTLPMMALYNKGKWILVKADIWGAPPKLTYNGASLIWGKNEFIRVE